MTGERLLCPCVPDPVPLDMPSFRAAVEHDRCPLSGCALEPWERAAGRGVDGAVVLVTTGRCAGGCGAEWGLHGDAEVAWWGREVVLDWDDEDPDEVATV